MMRRPRRRSSLILAEAIKVAEAKAADAKAK
jgi:hypothetical protein